MLSQEYEVEMKIGLLSLPKMKSPGMDHMVFLFIKLLRQRQLSILSRFPVE